VVTAAPPRQARGQRPPALEPRVAAWPFAWLDEPSRDLAADRPQGCGSLRIAPAEIRSYSGLIRLIDHTVVENEHGNTRLRDD
jgi:hypothetical protein